MTPTERACKGGVGGVVSSTLHKLNFREVKLPQTMPGVSGPVAFEPTSVRLPHFQLLQNSFPSDRFLLKTTCVQSHSLEPDTLTRCWMEEKKEKKKAEVLDVLLSNYVTLSKSPITSIILMFNSVIVLRSWSEEALGCISHVGPKKYSFLIHSFFIY